MKRVVGIIICFVLIMNMAVTIRAEEEPSDWAAVAIDSLVHEEVIPEAFMTGYKEPISRGDYAYLVYKLFEALQVDLGQFISIDHTYDLTDTDDFVIEALYMAGVISGYPNGTYRPDQTITRQEICSLYVKALTLMGVDLEENMDLLGTYSDGDAVANWSKSGIAKCLDAGIINGVSGNRIAPLGTASKEQSLVMLYRILESQTLLPQEDLVGLCYEDTTLAYDQDYAYHIATGLDGQVLGVDVYLGKVFEKRLPIKPIDGTLDVTHKRLFYKTEEGLMVYHLDSESETQVMTGIGDYFAVGEAIYFVSGKSLGRISALKYNSSESLYIGQKPLEVIKGFGHDDMVTVYVVDEDKTLFRYEAGAFEKLSQEVADFLITPQRIYLIKTDGSLVVLEDGSEKVLDTGVDSMTLLGSNLLYIKNMTELYNDYRGHISMIYSGNGLEVSGEHLYIRLSETTMGDYVYNHLVTLPTLKSYLTTQ